MQTSMCFNRKSYLDIKYLSGLQAENWTKIGLLGYAPLVITICPGVFDSGALF